MPWCGALPGELEPLLDRAVGGDGLVPPVMLTTSQSGLEALGAATIYSQSQKKYP